MRKFLSILLIAVMAMLCFSACSEDGDSQEDGNELQEGIKIVTTIFPEYDWARVILGDNPSGAELILLTDNGVDIHSFQPSMEDILNISTCDVLIRIGGESEDFVEDALGSKRNENMKEAVLLDIVGERAKEEEIREGMQPERGEEEEGETEYDEHVWLSLKNAKMICEGICDAICEADPPNEAYYRSNLEEYKDELDKLDKEYSERIDQAELHTLLFGDRFPFRYLVDDYGLDYYAAFVGCSAETEASFETITFLAAKVDELDLGCVLTIENSDERLAETIIANTETKDQKILTLDSLQSVTRDQLGTSYIEMMRKDLDVICEALEKDPER